MFPCNRWLARDEEDKAIERDLVPEKVIDESYTASGDVKSKEKNVRDRLESKKSLSVFFNPMIMLTKH